MTWTAPPVTRHAEPFTANERTTLEALLEGQRTTLLHKCAGLTGEQLAQRSTPPSGLSLLGLIRHLAKVERAWFRIRVAGEPIELQFSRTDEDFDDGDPSAAEVEYAHLLEEIELARKAAAGVSLDDTFSHPRHGEMSLRWTYLHMIEEYNRHNGHADLLRERIDGVTGA